MFSNQSDSSAYSDREYSALLREPRMEMKKRKESPPFLYKVSDDGKVGVVSDLDHFFVSHESDDTEHGGAAVVQFDCALLEFGFLVELVPSEVDVPVSEVTREFVSGSWHVLHEGNFEESDEADDLSDTLERDGIGSLDGGDAVRVRSEAVSGEVDVTPEMDSGSCDDLSQNGKHTNTSVLDFGVSQTVEVFLVGVAVQQTQRIEESEWWLDTELILEGGQRSCGCRLLLDGCERRGGCDE